MEENRNAFILYLNVDNIFNNQTKSQLSWREKLHRKINHMSLFHTAQIET